MKYTKTLMAVAATAALTISCSDKDIFDKEAYNKLITEAFPVENVDPTHDWKTIGSADVNITLMQSSDGYSVIRIFDGEPGDESTHLLAKDSIANGSTMTTSINYQLDSTDVNIVVTDAEGFSSIYPRTIENGALTTTVGNAQTTTKTRSAAGITRASSVAGVTYNFAEDYNGGVYPTADNIENTIVVLSGNTYTVTEETIKDKTIIVCEGGKLVADNEFTLENTSLYNAGTMATDVVNLVNGTVAYNRGTWTTKTSKSGQADIDVGITDTSTQSSQLVNAGTMTLDGDLEVGGAFLNLGTFTCDQTNIAFSHSDITQNAWVNEGQYKNKGDFDFNDTFKIEGKGGYTTQLSEQVFNNCKLEIDGNFSFSKKGLIFNNNAGAYVFVDGTENKRGMDVDKDAGSLTLNLGSKSILKVDATIKINNTVVNGPTSDDASALILSNVFNGGQDNGSTAKLNGNILFAVSGSNSWTNYKKIDGIDYYGHASSLEGLNANIDATACSPGYTGTYKPTYPEVTEQPLRYCFEDNYPSAGDYDFNDIVMDISVSSTLLTRTATYNVTLTAVGAIKQIAAALRLNGIPVEDIESVTITGDLYDYNLNTSSINTDIIKKKFTNGTFTSDGSGNTVIYLFNDAHYAYTRATSTTGGVDRPFINTIKPEETTVDARVLPPVKCKVEVKFNSLFDGINFRWFTSTDHMDPFIITEYNGGNWEVHTIDWKTKPALFDYGDSDNYSINLPWALCLPSDFKYPKEFIPIGNYKGGTLGGAYQTAGHSFGEWCGSMEKAKDWYLSKYADSDKVYK